MTEPKPIKLTRIASAGYEGPAPEPMVVIGDIPAGAGEVTSVANVEPVNGNVPLAVSDLTFPDGWAASMVLGTHMSNTDLTPVPYSQAAGGDTIVQRSLTGTIVAAEATMLSEVVILSQLDEKVEHVNAPFRVYATDNANNDTDVLYGAAATASYMVQRDTNAQINVPATPTAAGHASAKSYVDGLTNAKTQIVALAPVATADATDLPTAVALANANKAAINAIIAALKA